MAPYTTETADITAQPEKIGLLIVNLGTPQAPTARAVRPYLAEFLGDPRIIELPRLLWLAVLHGIILNVRPRRSAKVYRSIWLNRDDHGEEGSPLLRNAERQAEALRAELGDQMEVALAMRYGEPSVVAGLDQLRQANVRRLIVLPMFPQYSATTVGSIFDAVADALKNWRWVPDLRFITHYYDDPAYIDALASSIRCYWDRHGQAEKLVLSYHGLPQTYVDKGDPYQAQCYATTAALVQALGLNEADYMTVFQSRFGPSEWLQPYFSDTMEHLPEHGITSVQVAAPSFSVDCLETLEEIAIAGEESFHEAGGKDFAYIPCLNDDAQHMAMFKNLVLRNIQDWLEPTQAEVSYSANGQTRAVGAPH
ncbi:MAG: ferrochelatase [Chloroflexi bacterium]|nr:ferrochelatase [Chloroflexota bacterium]